MARTKAETEQYAFRVYVTDGLKCVTENTARYAGGSSLTARWTEIIDPTPVVVDDRPCDEIAADIWARIRGKKE